jgi:hypothetical protein
MTTQQRTVRRLIPGALGRKVASLMRSQSKLYLSMGVSKTAAVRQGKGEVDRNADR